MIPGPSSLTDLLPRPSFAEGLPGVFALRDRAVVWVSAAGSARALFAAERLAELIGDEFGVSLDVQSLPGDGVSLSIGDSGRHELIAGGGDLGSEGYVLEVTENAARVQSATPEGLFWGTMTLRQLAEHCDGGPAIRCARIVDRPRYRWRGFMIDSGRSPNGLPKIKRIIRICSALRLNLLVFREGDDELCSVRYDTNLLGSRNPYAFTMGEIRDLVDYGDRYGVTVAPEIESLGHSTAKGFHYPELVSGGFEHPYEGIGVHVRKSHLAPADPRSYALLESVYREWFSILRGPFAHLGLDEVRLDPEVQARHLEGLLPVVGRVARSCGKDVTPIVWADAPATPGEFRGRVIRCLWAYGDSVERVGPENSHLVRQGLLDLSEPGCEEQVMMAAGSGSGHTPGSKTCYEDAFLNLAEWAIWGAGRPNFTGLLAVQWSGNMTDEWLPDFATAADCAWNPPERVPEFDAQMARVRQQLSRLRDAVSPPTGEVDPPAWDGIWLRGGRWHEDIVHRQRPGAA